jgi:hypothetical protein
MYDDFNIFERFAPRYLWVGCLVQFLSTRNDTHLLEHMRIGKLPRTLHILESLIWIMPGFGTVSTKKATKMIMEVHGREAPGLLIAARIPTLSYYTLALLPDPFLY